MSCNTKNGNNIVFKMFGDNDINITPFEANKSYTLNQSNYSGSGYSVIKCIFPQHGIYRRDIPPLETNSYNPVQNNNQFDVHVSWYSLRHNYYQGSNDWDYNHLNNQNINTNRTLYCSASIISVPQKKFGNSIKRGSVSITDKSSGYDINFIDDSDLNLIDTSLSNSYIISDDNLIFYYGFNEKFSHQNLTDINRDICLDNSKYKKHADVIGSVGFSNGIYTHGNVISQSGYKADFSGVSSSIIIQNNDKFVLEDDFAMSFWIDIPDTQFDLEYEKNYIISKRTYDIEEVFNQNKGTIDFRDVEGTYTQYPFDVYIYNSNNSFNGKLGISRYGGTAETTITSSNILTGSQHHIVLQKNSGNIELYVDGELDVQVSDNSNGKVSNKSNIYIGSLANRNSYLSGSIDEYRLYDRVLTSGEVGYLYNNDFLTGSAYQTNIIGNVFYDTGIIAMSDPRPKYNYLFTGTSESNGFDMSYKATVKLYEHEMMCRVNMKDYNTTMNETILVNPDNGDGVVKETIHSNQFSPYITTIGFYNNNYELLAVGKLARPIKKRNDVDMTFVCRFDI